MPPERLTTPDSPGDQLARGRRWLDDWTAVGDVLADERRRENAGLDDDGSWAMAEALSALWEPTWAGDAGQGLMLQQQVFARARRPA